MEFYPCLFVSLLLKIISFGIWGPIINNTSMLHPNLEQHWKQRNQTNEEPTDTFITKKHNNGRGGRYLSLCTDCLKWAFILLGSKVHYQVVLFMLPWIKLTPNCRLTCKILISAEHKRKKGNISHTRKQLFEPFYFIFMKEVHLN